MISDQSASAGWNSDFQLKGQFGFGLDVMMLTSGSWEIPDPKCGQKLVPPQLLPAVEGGSDPGGRRLERGESHDGRYRRRLGGRGG